jgi:hypothetical protein
VLLDRIEVVDSGIRRGSFAPTRHLREPEPGDPVLGVTVDCRAVGTQGGTAIAQSYLSVTQDHVRLEGPRKERASATGVVRRGGPILATECVLAGEERLVPDEAPDGRNAQGDGAPEDGPRTSAAQLPGAPALDGKEEDASGKQGRDRDADHLPVPINRAAERPNEEGTDAARDVADATGTKRRHERNEDR